mgnify:CR=1 FL=1
MGWLRKTRIFLISSVAVALIILAVAFTLLRGMLPHATGYIAEIERGISAQIGLPVSIGSIDAEMHWFTPRLKVLNLVILPQALRVIIPPLTSQMLNLTKNSSLAVAIGYPDFVSVAGTAINQTGQAIEGVAMIMIVYLCFSLSTSAFMNWYNKKVTLVER